MTQNAALSDVSDVGIVRSAKRQAVLAAVGAVRLLCFAALAVACGSEAASPEEGSNDTPVGSENSLVYETRQFFEGLEEWIVIHKSPSEYYCVRADGRRQDCGAVHREDEAAHYGKWGVMTRAFGLKVVSAKETTLFEAYVTYDVQVPERMDGAAREKFFADVRAGGERLTKQIVDGGGEVIVPPTSSMPELSMRGPASLIKQLAWSRGIVLISERLHGDATPVGRNAGSGL